MSLGEQRDDPVLALSGGECQRRFVVRLTTHGFFPINIQTFTLR